MPGVRVAVRSSLRDSRYGLILIAVVALGLRLYGLNWDEGHLFHPDERHILMVTQRLADKLAASQPISPGQLLQADSPLNPQSFAYGSLPFYLLLGVSSFLRWLDAAAPGLDLPAQLRSFGGMGLVGRSLSALFDVGTVLITYALGRRLYGQWVGLLGASFVATTVLHVQLSHFYASDTILTFFVVAALLCLVRFVQEGASRWMLLAAIAVGLALASKISAAPVLVAVGVAALLWGPAAGKVGTPEWRPNWLPRLHGSAKMAAKALAVALATFVIFEPYALIDLRTFVQHVGEQGAMARGLADLPYTRQYADRTPYLYFLQNLTLFGFGLPLGLAALGGWLYVLVRLFRAPRLGDLLLLSWVVPYFAITGGFHAKFLRYLLPITPLLCLFAAEALVRLWRWANRPAAKTAADAAAGGHSAQVERVGPGDDAEQLSPSILGWRRPSWLRPAAMSLLAVVVGLTALYALAYVRMYAEPHPAVAASRWIYQHVPPGSGIATEHWEEGLPVPLEAQGRSLSAGSQGYRMATLNLYEDDNEAKLSHIVQRLQAADYVVFFSNRLYGTIPRLPQRYPMTTEYYRLLFGEKLGYQLVAAFTSYPNLAGVTLVDDTLADPGLPTPALLARQQLSPVVLNLGRADESFSVYDHPKVLVFQRTQRLSESEMRSLLRPALIRPRLHDAESSPPEFRSLLLSPAQSAANAAGGTFRELFNRDDFANRWPVLVWALMAQALGLAAMPLAFGVLRGLADRGYLLAKTLGVLVLGWLAWMLVAVGPLPNGRVPVYLALAILVAAGLVGLALQRGQIAAFIRLRWRLLLASEAVFWGAFLLFLAIRLANPDLWHPARGGEKPMDLAYLMAAIKTTTFPPYDPWFAGGYLNYYYYGQVLVATLVKLSGVVPTTAYNLVVPLLFALTVAGGFSVAYNLIGEEMGRSRALAGALAAAVFLGVLGNLGGGGQLALQLASLGDLAYRGPVPGLAEVARFFGGIALAFLGRPLHIPTDWYWPSTRVIPGTINEFPFFTFLYADLHAHMIALPLTLLALGLAVSAVKSGLEGWHPTVSTRSGGTYGAAALSAVDSGGTSPGHKGRALARGIGRLIVDLVVLGLVIGALMPTNSWDYPTYLGIVGLALVIPWHLSRQRRADVLGALALRFAAIGGLSYVLYLPFHHHFQSFYFGVKPALDKSPIGGYLLIHGFFLAALLSFVVMDFFSRFGRNGTLRCIGLTLRRWERLPRLLSLRRRLMRQDDEAGAVGLIVAASALAIAVVLALLGMELVGLLLVCLVLVGGLALLRDRPAEESFLLTLFAVGLALGIATELVAIDGDVGRMNTVFKFYLQVWVLWSIGAAVALARSWQWLTGGRRHGLKQLWLGFLALLLLFSTAYPLVGTAARVRDRFDTSIPPTLDGTAYMRNAVYVDQNREIHLRSDLEAIRWLQDNVVGSPVILEGHAPLYRWGSRVSIYTGLPTVIGWDWHQKQQRWGYQEQIDQRVHDVRAMYSDPSIPRTLALLDSYRVAYVYVGELERAYYPAASLAKFDQMIGEHLELVYDRGGVRIYRVLGQDA